jgi:RimJ/RimL family protein N-acetyltransferase
LAHDAAMILGERVRLRRVERADLPRFVAWLNDVEVRDHLALYHPMGLADEEIWFAKQADLEPVLRPLAIEARAADVRREAADPEWTLIGATSFHHVDWKNRWAELGIMIGEKAWWGRGYGTDATRALARWGFDELGLNRVCLRVFEDNARARRAYEKVGFREEGRLRQDRFHAGRYVDTIVMGLLRDELAR